MQNKSGILSLPTSLDQQYLAMGKFSIVETRRNQTEIGNRRKITQEGIK